MIKQLLKGAVIGVANIIPGVSGGTMAVSMGIYDKLIHAVTHLKKEFKESVKFILPIIIGAVIGIGALSFVILALLEHLPVQTNFLFIGLIIGGMPVIWNRLKGTGNKINVANIIVLIGFFALVVGFAAIGEPVGAAADVSFSLGNVVTLFGVGVIASATMVIPGVSGSMVLMLMGYYETILATIESFIIATLSFDLPAIIEGFGVLAPFGVGILVGIALIAKLIEIIFVKLPNYAYSGIMGLIIASPVAIIMMSDLARYNIVSIGTGIITLAVGYFIAIKLGEE